MAYGATFLNCWPIVFVLADKKRELEVSQSHRSKTYLLTNEKDSNTLFRRVHIYYNGENGRRKSSTSVDSNQPSRLSSFIPSYTRADFKH